MTIKLNLDQADVDRMVLAASTEIHPGHIRAAAVRVFQLRMDHAARVDPGRFDLADDENELIEEWSGCQCFTPMWPKPGQEEACTCYEGATRRGDENGPRGVARPCGSDLGVAAARALVDSGQWSPTNAGPNNQTKDDVMNVDAHDDALLKMLTDSRAARDKALGGAARDEPQRVDAIHLDADDLDADDLANVVEGMARARAARDQDRDTDQGYLRARANLKADPGGAVAAASRMGGPAGGSPTFR